MKKEIEQRIEQIWALIRSGFYKTATERFEAEKKISRLQTLLEDMTYN